MNKANLAAGAFLLTGTLALGAATTYAALDDDVPASSDSRDGDDKGKGQDKGLHLGRDHEGRNGDKDNGLHLGQRGEAPGQNGTAPGHQKHDKAGKKAKDDKPGKGPKAR